MQLNVYISKSGYCSRRKADLLIKEGRVTVDGIVHKKPFHEVSEKYRICVDSKAVVLKKPVYIAFNKPKGITTTCADKFAQKTIIDFFPQSLKGIFPVGRLDKDTSGLIILTNDGNLCHKTTHPKFQIEKEYKIILDKTLSQKDSPKALSGIKDAADTLKVKKITRLKEETYQFSYNVVICEGKKRHLRRLFNALGYFVLGLKRIRIGGLSLGSLKPGEYKFISQEQIYHLLFANPKLQ